MYKSYTANDYKKLLTFPEDYHVDGMIIYGSTNKQQGMDKLIDSLNRAGKLFELNDLPGFMSRVSELRINDKVFWFNVAYGGTLLSEYLHLVCLFGSKQNILIGSCGGLKKGLTPGTVILPTFSYGDGSTASLYQREITDNLYPSDNQLRKSLKNSLELGNVTTREGKTMTCQAMMAETWDDVVSWSNQGFVGVEMEAAAVFSTSNHFGVPAAAMVVLSDNLIEEQTVLDESYQQTREIKHKTLQTIFDITISLMMK